MSLSKVQLENPHFFFIGRRVAKSNVKYICIILGSIWSDWEDCYRKKSYSIEKLFHTVFVIHQPWYSWKATVHLNQFSFGLIKSFDSILCLDCGFTQLFLLFLLFLKICTCRYFMDFLFYLVDMSGFVPSLHPSNHPM